MSRRRRGTGISLTGILIIGGLLYFTPAGTWLWSRIKQLDTSCYEILQKMNIGFGEGMCSALSKGLHALDDGTSGLLDRIKGKIGDSGNGRLNDLGAYAQSLFDRIGQGNGSLADLVSSNSRLSQLMQGQPVVLPSAVDAKERLRMALDQFVIGQHYLQGSSPSQAMPWLQQSAQQPGGYGVLSQLTLGDLYRTGSYGVGENTSAARDYYVQAIRSIASLQQANTVEARQLLSNLPAPPDQLAGQLKEQVARMK